MARAFLLIAVLLSGCAAQSAPITYGRGAPPQRQPARVERVTPPQQPVRRETPPQAAPDWADGEGTPLSAYALRPEDAQPFDPAQLPRTHRVARNETLYEISDRYQIPLAALAQQNNLAPPYNLTPGTEIEFPPPRVHVVARGETLRDVAERYSIDYRSLALLNRLQPPYEVNRGDRIVLPAVAGEWAAEVMATPASQTPAATPSGPARFQWPVRGQVVARFGARQAGGRLDGIEIASRAGAPIGAAADGDVVYAGSDVPGYETLVLVRHPDGYVTAYGYARRALVRVGQSVRAGEPLAEASGERVLFQARHGREAVDPLPLLGG